MDWAPKNPLEIWSKMLEKACKLGGQSLQPAKKNRPSTQANFFGWCLDSIPPPSLQIGQWQNFFLLYEISVLNQYRYATVPRFLGRDIAKGPLGWLFWASQKYWGHSLAPKHLDEVKKSGGQPQREFLTSLHHLLIIGCLWRPLHCPPLTPPLTYLEFFGQHNLNTNP